MGQTFIIGICEINYRRYFVGMWPNIETCRTDLHPRYTIADLPLESEEEHPWGPEPSDYNAVRHWGADDTGVDDESAVGFVGADVDGFSLYEVDIHNLPNFVGFDED